MTNIKVLIYLSQDLIDKYAIYELNTGNINHNCVENLFSRMRREYRQPSGAECSTEYIKLCIVNYFIQFFNCELDAGELLINMEELRKLPVILT